MIMMLTLLVSLVSQIAIMSVTPTTPHMLTLRAAIEPNPANVWFCVQFKSLQEKWSPRHCGGLSPKDTLLIDEWPNMPKGAYEVTAELFRNTQPVQEFDSVAVRVVVR